MWSHAITEICRVVQNVCTENDITEVCGPNQYVVVWSKICVLNVNREQYDTNTSITEHAVQIV